MKQVADRDTMLRVVVSAAVVLSCASVVSAFGTNCGRPVSEQPKGGLKRSAATPRNFKIAFFGDQGVRNASTEVMKLVLREGAEAIVHGGDFDYKDSPSEWIDSLDKVLGRDYPVFAAVGNHDLPAWEGANGYASLLEKRMRDQGTWDMCEGELGVNMVCDFHGILILSTGVGTRGKDHVQYVDQTFSAYPAHWKACNWHKNQRLYQVGGKSDETGYEIYDVCRHHGALIATAHEHSYSRTWLMKNFAEQKIADSTSGTNINDPMVVQPGAAPAWVSGVAGQSLRVCLQDLEKNPWWASYGCTDNDIDYGALFCTFNLNGWKDRAHCEFKTIEGVVWDSFWLVSGNSASTPVAPLRPVARHVEVTADTDGGFVAAVSSTGEVVCSPPELFVPQKLLKRQPKQPASAVLHFAVAPSLLSGRRIEHAHLELYGMVDLLASHASLVIDVLALGESPSCSSDSVARQHGVGASLRWVADEDDGGWERHEVWTSPDLSDLITSALERCPTCIGVTLRVSQLGAPLRAHSGAQDRCLSPTLVLQTAK